MKIKLLIIGTIGALSILSTSPAMGATIDNQLANAPGALQYIFSPSFKENIEEVEKRHGLEIYIYAKPYNAATPLLDVRKNAGANFADQKLAELIDTPGFKYDNAVIITWLRNQDQPVKGSLGVAPGSRLKDMGVEGQDLSDSVSAAINGHMPGNPSAAIVSIVDRMDAPFRGLDTLLTALRLAGGFVAIGFIGGVLRLGYGKFIDVMGSREEIQIKNFEVLKATKGSIESSKTYYSENLEYPSILFDLRLADENIGQTVAAKYDELMSAIKKELDTLIKEFGHLSKTFNLEGENATINAFVLGKRRIESFDIKCLAKVNEHQGFLESLDKDYGQFLEVRSSKELLAAMIPATGSFPTIKAWGEDYVFHFSVDAGCDPQSFLEQLPLEFSDFSLFLSQIENAKDWNEKGLDIYKKVAVAIEKIEFIKDWVTNPEQAITLSSKNTEADRKQYEEFRSVAESSKDNSMLQLETTISKVQLSLTDGRYVSLFQFVDDLERWFSSSITSPIQEMNRIAKLPALRAEEEKQRQVATEAAKVEAVLKKKNDRRNYGSSNYSSLDSSSSSSSSGDYSSSSSSSSYDSSSSGSDYSSGSGGSDY